MEDFNKQGKITRYYTLDEILKLNIPKEIKDEYSEKFGKKVFFDKEGVCKVGILTGIERNEMLSMLYYIIDNKTYVPVWHSLTKI